MKKIFKISGLILAAVFALTSCTKELESPEQTPEQKGTPFEISTEISTKTVNSGMSTLWNPADQLAVFYSPQNSGQYSTVRQFSMDPSEENKFSGTIDRTAAPLGLYNDWFAVYPFNNSYISPAGKTEVTIACPAGGSQKQDKANPTAHLAGEYFPLWGKDLNRKSDSRPVLKMHQVATLIKVNVTSSLSQSVRFCNIALQVPGKALVGAFNLDLSGSELKVLPVPAKTDEMAVLAFPADELASGETKSYYLAVAPFEVSPGDEIILKVGNYGKVKHVSRKQQFGSGKIIELNFNLDREPSVVTIPWKESFNLQYTSLYYNSCVGVKLYEEGTAYAGGTIPELGISKSPKEYNNKFVFQADLSGLRSGMNLNLSCKSNHPDYLRLTADVPNIRLEEISPGFWNIILTGSYSAPVTFSIENIKSSNLRIDDVQLTESLRQQTLSFAEPVFKVRGASSSSGQLVSGAVTPVTYMSSNQAVATIDARSGALTLLQLGKSTITAVADGTSEFAPAQATYDLLHLPVPSNIDKRVYLVVFKDEKTNKQYALTGIPNADNKHLEAVELTDLDAKMSNGEYVAENQNLLWNASAADGDKFILKCGYNYLSNADGGYIAVNASSSSAAALTAVKKSGNLYKLCLETATDLSFIKYDGNPGFRFSYGDHGNHLLELIPARADSRPRLDAPNINVTPYASSKYVRLMWSSVPNAEEYVVECDGQHYQTVSSNKCDVYNLEFGNHQFKVIAKAPGYIDGVGVKNYEFVDPYNRETVLTLDFKENIFEQPTENPATRVEQTFTYGGYTYKFYGPGSCYYFGGKALFLGKSGAYIEVPALSGKRLTSVSAINAAGASSTVELAVETTGGNVVTGGGNIIMEPAVEKTWSLSGTSSNTPYRLVVKNSKNVQLTRIILKYN